MGIVKISEEVHEHLRIASAALSRSINAQAEHWMRIGMLSELHPNLDHSDICRLLIRAELAGGLELKQLCALADSVEQQPRVSAGAEQ
ncbi:ParD-like family protein [Pseudomonas sp. SZMC_28357]|uniref:ParD-like family protein n=1 Tax=Pseudomonas sp. SZMC_28357 TaxID=3074380 RepID=UPI002872824A|nr:ParD-like family protein [Pseudomonas sp. SZMC_28357]MDR9753598.1 ParD-like family protein [Pseudomonas sp. SZMC_28357]